MKNSVSVIHSGIKLYVLQSQDCLGIAFASERYHLVSNYGIKSDVLVIDEIDKEQSKNTIEIAKVHKVKDKRAIV